MIQGEHKTRVPYSSLMNCLNNQFDWLNASMWIE